MIKAVLLFGGLNVLFEFVLLAMLPVRWRLRLLGSSAATALLHFGFLSANLTIHWGTLIGTMSGVLAFVLSIVTVSAARLVFGYIEHDRYYHIGLMRYDPTQLR